MTFRRVLAASSARTTTGNGNGVAIQSEVRSVAIEFDVSAAATLAGDTLDLFVQTKVGDNWVDVVHFTQVLGNGGTKRFFAKLSGDQPQAEFEDATALGAAAVRHLIGDELRARWAIAGTGSFTFSVSVLGE